MEKTLVRPSALSEENSPAQFSVCGVLCYKQQLLKDVVLVGLALRCCSREGVPPPVARESARRPGHTRLEGAGLCVFLHC